MFKTLFLFLTLLSLSACYYKKLGCIICHTHTKKKESRYSNGRLYMREITQYKSNGIDTPLRIKWITKTCDEKGNLIEKNKMIRISSIWDLDRTSDLYYLKQIIRTIDTANSGRLKEKIIIKNGIEKIKKIEKRKL